MSVPSTEMTSPALETKAVLEGFQELTQHLRERHINECMARMQEGALKYGPSWNEVDLKTDVQEELYDIINYAVLMWGRLAALGVLTSDDRFDLHAIVDYCDEILFTLSKLPDFDGPTSAEWAAARNR